ncbi:flagellar assembly protein FliH [Halomonas salifodinae]|uniref:Flagellar assembly protein FliH n=1 Tax=Halomonas salifodinae TaxID=438745 RepID=A0ABW2EXV7_9GAMM
MSESHRDASDDWDDSWRRWQMGELGSPQRDQVEREHRRRDALRQAARRRDEELARIREQVRQAARDEGYRAGLASGREEGYAQGLAEGRAAAETELARQLEATLTPLRELAAGFREALDGLDDQVAEELVALALATGRQLAGEALAARPEQVVDLVRELLHVEPPLNGGTRLWLHPDDLALVTPVLGDELAALGWKLQPDDALSRGGCRVTSASGELDATWERRWEAVTERLRHRAAPRRGD